MVQSNVNMSKLKRSFQMLAENFSNVLNREDKVISQ